MGPFGARAHATAGELAAAGGLTPPKNFSFAFLPQFIGAGETHALFHMLELSLVFMLLTFVVFAGYGIFAAAARNHVISRPRVLARMRRLFAGAFIALGARLLTS